MPHLFYPIYECLFRQQIQPILAACRRERSFAPGRELFEELLPRVRAYHASYQGLATQTLVEQAVHGLSFDSAVWRALVGEVLLFAAADLPLLRLAPQSLCLLAGWSSALRRESEPPQGGTPTEAPIRQVLYGSRDLVFAGSCYRPDRVAYNDQADVVRLAEFLQAVDPARWQVADLAEMTELPDDEDRAEELEFVRQGWPELVELYQKASEKKQIIVCERD